MQKPHRLRALHRLLSWPVLLVAIVLSWSATALAGATDAAPPPFDWMGLGVVLSSVTSALALVLHFVGSWRGNATVIKIADDVDSLHGKVGEIRGLLAPDRSPPVGAVLLAPGRSPPPALAALLVLGILGTPALSSCTSAERAAAAADVKATVQNCTATALGAAPGLDLATMVAVVNLTATERLKCMTATGLSWACIETDAIGKGLTLGGCMFVDLLAAASKAIAPSTSALAESLMPAPTPGRPEFEAFRARVAPTGVRLTFHSASGDY